MRNPAEVVSSNYFETCFGERVGVFLQSRKITLRFILLPSAQAVLQCAAESRKTVVHVDDNAHAAGHEQIEDVLNTIDLLPGAMTESNGIDAENEMKRVF